MRVIYGVVDGKRKIVILETRKCEVCGNEFEPKKQESKYCSKKCGKKADYKRNAEYYRNNSSEWYKNNLEKAKENRKNRYWSNPEYWRGKTREYVRLHKETVKKRDNEIKDKIRHGGKRRELIQQNGLTCSLCGKTGEDSRIDVHHVTFDKHDHSRQILLCASCHTKVHHQRSSTRVSGVA